MSLIEFFGDTLSKKIGKEDLVGRGLILYAIQDEVGRTDVINFDVLKKTFEKSLKSRLEKVAVHNVDKVCDEMVKELVKNQSLLTMGIV